MESSESDNKMGLFSQYDNHKRNYKPVNDMCFSLILSQVILLLIISWFQRSCSFDLLLEVPQVSSPPQQEQKQASTSEAEVLVPMIIFFLIYF